MQLPYLTISEAAQKTGRSESTIRRVIKTIAKAETHPDRTGVEPPVSAVKDFKKKGENFTWKICEDVLLKNLSRVRAEEKKQSTFSDEKQESKIMDILSQELERKNQFIEKQWEVITALNERLREGNILMGTLQKRLALPEASLQENVVEAVTMKPSMKASRKAPKKASTEASKSPSMKASTEPSMEAVAPASSTAKKKGIFAWFSRI